MKDKIMENLDVYNNVASVGIHSDVSENDIPKFGTYASVTDFTRGLKTLLKEFSYNKTYIPRIKNVVYTLGKKAYPKRDANGKIVKDEKGKIVLDTPTTILTTTVFFDDGTKSVVTNSLSDKINLIHATDTVTKIDSNGKAYTVTEEIDPPILIADDVSKENGLVYAIVKRLYGRCEDTGVINGNGFGRQLHDAVANACDSAMIPYLKEKAKQERMLKHEQLQAEEQAKAAKRKPSLAKTVAKLAETVNKLEAKLDKMA